MIERIKMYWRLKFIYGFIMWLEFNRDDLNYIKRLESDFADYRYNMMLTHGLLKEEKER